MPSGHRLTESPEAWHPRWTISPWSRMRYAPSSIGYEQTGHVDLGVATDYVFSVLGRPLSRAAEVWDAPRPSPAVGARMANRIRHALDSGDLSSGRGVHAPAAYSRKAWTSTQRKVVCCLTARARAARWRDRGTPRTK
jgi:hypothetical protein